MIRCCTVWYGVVRCGTVWYGVVRNGTGWYGVVRSGTGLYGVYVVVRGGTGWYGVVRSEVINPALDIRSILLVNGGHLAVKECNIICKTWIDFFLI